MKAYFPYPSDKPEKKYFIITSKGKRVYFGASGYEDYTMHKDPKRKELYIKRHSKMGENWGKSGIDTAGFWSRWLLWNKTTLETSYQDIKQRYLL